MRAISLFIICLLTACVQTEVPTSDIAKTIVAEHARAFNLGNVAAMSKVQHPDIEWLSVTGSQISVKVSGRDALAENMTDYFKSPTKVTGTLRDWSVNGNYVAVTETASWKAKDGTAKSQSSLTVYQLKGNLIRRVWYYPAVD